MYPIYIQLKKNHFCEICNDFFLITQVPELISHWLKELKMSYIDWYYIDYNRSHIDWKMYMRGCS